MDPIDELKRKVISEFMQFMQNASLGIYKDYNHIIDEISFIEYLGEVKNKDFIYCYLMNK